MAPPSTRPLIPLEDLRPHFEKWQKFADLVDSCIDFMLNLRQSGHPGGSRSKVHQLITTLFSGAMRFDIRDPTKRFGDRFVLIAGHTIPLIYATLTLLNEAMQARYEETNDPRFLVPEPKLTWQDLLTLRHRGGLSGHAEMSGKTLFLKFNTGPSGHGNPAAVGEAFALKFAGVGNEVRVFAFEGEGGLTTGVTHESKNSAYGLGLGNLVYVIDWNDFGIDHRPYSDVMAGTPVDWFKPYGFHVEGTEAGENFESLVAAYHRLLDRSGSGSASDDDNDSLVPKAFWSKNRKGRGYGKFDAPSHGAPHATNSDVFWATKVDFQNRYGVQFQGFGQPAPKDAAALHQQHADNFKLVMDVLRRDRDLVHYLTDHLVKLGDSVPETLPSFKSGLDGEFPLAADSSLTDYRNYPAKLYAAPGTNAANRAALDKFGSWINTYCREKFGRPLVLATSADLAESTNIAGFMKGWDGAPAFGFYNRKTNTDGTLLPQPITEMANSGIMAGIATVNFSKNPRESFNGFIGACSTYGSFSYLKYGLFRLFSQLVQDCELKCGKIIWVVGHSGVETAEDFRTHFGIFSPGVTQLFPNGRIINIHPYEHNEVYPLLGAALATDVHLIALHLTRPAIKIPDRVALGIPSHFEAAKGAYVMLDYRPNEPRAGVVIVRGTSSTANVVELIPKIHAEGPNVKVVAATSDELFRMQSQEYRDSVITAAEMNDAMIVFNGAFRLMQEWVTTPITREYSLAADWDDRWRTGGSVEECIDEAHIDKKSIWDAVTRFAAERPQRLERLKAAMPQ